MNRALLAAAATGVQVGAAIAASRLVVQDVPPLTLALLRYAIGFLCLLPFVRPALTAALPVAERPVRGTPAWWRDMAVLALLGMGQFALLIALLNYGLQFIGAAPAAMIFSVFPLLTLLLSAALGQERISLALLGGVLLSMAGVLLALVPKFSAAQAGHHWLGELAVFASACVGALCSVLYRPYLKRYPTVPVSALAMFASVLLLALLALPEHWPQRVTQLTAMHWSVVAFIGLSSGVGYFMWLYALKHESPTRVTVFLALNPVTAALCGAAFLGEPLNAWLLSAMALIAMGLWLASRRGT